MLDTHPSRRLPRRGDRCRIAGQLGTVRYVTFIRHGQLSATPWVGVELDGCLTYDGRQVCDEWRGDLLEVVA